MCKYSETETFFLGILQVSQGNKNVDEIKMEVFNCNNKTSKLIGKKEFQNFI